MVLRYHGGKQNLRESVNRGLVFALVNLGRVETSKPRSRQIIQLIEGLVNTAKKDTVAARRSVFASMDADSKSTARIFDVIMPRYKERTGGYTTFVSLGRRLGDNGERVRIEWIGGQFPPRELKVARVPKVPKVSKAKEVEKKSISKKATKK